MADSKTLPQKKDKAKLKASSSQTGNQPTHEDALETLHPVLQLQQTLGNKAVQKLLLSDDVQNRNQGKNSLRSTKLDAAIRGVQVANRISKKQIQRLIVVEDPANPLANNPAVQNWEVIRDYMQDLAPAFSVNSAGQVTPTAFDLCYTTSRYTDKCLCDLDNSLDPEPWKIKVDDQKWPQTSQDERRVWVQSPYSGIRLGAWGGGAQAGQRIEQDGARVLGHEICGHAWLYETGDHPDYEDSYRRGRLMGRPSHDKTVRVENRVAQDIYGPNAPERGEFSAPHHGESFGRVTVSGFPTDSANVDSLPTAAKEGLDRVKNFMAADDRLKADLIGHADHRGNAALNNNLSRQRALNVQDHFDNNEISWRRFYVKGKGYNECPAEPLDNPDCRKVDIYMYIYEGASERFP